MKSAKFLLLLCVGLLFASFALAQQQETTVEQEYLSSVEDVIIRELADTDDRDNKLVSLQYIESAISGGRTSPDIMFVLESLAGEGVSTQSRTNGRLMNNFPDVRAKSCDLLGEVKTEEAKTILVKTALADNEPMVVTAAIRSLGNIGINEQDEVVATIIWVQKKYATLNPTSSLALEILFAYEKLADTVEDKTPMIESISAIASNHSLNHTVRRQALDLLRQLTGASGSNSR